MLPYILFAALLVFMNAIVMGNVLDWVNSDRKAPKFVQLMLYKYPRGLALFSLKVLFDAGSRWVYCRNGYVEIALAPEGHRPYQRVFLKPINKGIAIMASPEVMMEIVIRLRGSGLLGTFVPAPSGKPGGVLWAEGEVTGKEFSCFIAALHEALVSASKSLPATKISHLIENPIREMRMMVEDGIGLGLFLDRANLPASWRDEGVLREIFASAEANLRVESDGCRYELFSGELSLGTADVLYGGSATEELLLLLVANAVRVKYLEGFDGNLAYFAYKGALLPSAQRLEAALAALAGSPKFVSLGCVANIVEAWQRELRMADHTVKRCLQYQEEAASDPAYCARNDNELVEAAAKRAKLLDLLKEMRAVPPGDYATESVSVPEPV